MEHPNHLAAAFFIIVTRRSHINKRKRRKRANRRPQRSRRSKPKQGTTENEPAGTEQRIHVVDPTYGKIDRSTSAFYLLRYS
jgi:hypothetical protein